MAINRISKARNLVVFQDFSWPSDLPNFDKFNLIYGWNGTGKTTLSDLFRALETKSNRFDAQVSIVIDGRSIDGGNFSTVDIPIRVFNRNFIQETVFTKNDEAAPIFVIGEENVEKQKRLEQLTTELVKDQEELGKLLEKKSLAENVLDKFRISRASAIRYQLTATGSAYTNYDKSDFEKTADKLAAQDDVSKYIIDDTKRERLLKQHLATAKQAIDLISYSFPDLSALKDEISQMLKQTVVSAVIESLRDDPDLAEWTRDGLNLHKDRNAAICLFCNQKLPQLLLGELETHFSDEYEGFLRAIDRKLREIQELLQSAKNISFPDEARLYEDLAAEYSAALVEFREEINRVCGALQQYEEALNTKKAAPFKQLNIDLATFAPRLETLEKVNSIIGEHNKASKEFDNRVTNARIKLEKAAVAVSIEEHKRLQVEVRSTGETVLNKQRSIAVKRTEQATLESEIIQHRKPAEELNADLRDYLGHDELSLTVKETGYQITRKEAVAKGLSEGETTAIALLYFLKSLRDQRFDLARGIVVLDDPVSSLDSNALFGAFGFIRARTEGAAQFFILTHNFTFFRAVRNWFKNLRGPDKNSWRIYMLECRRGPTGRCSVIREIDPLLKDFESEYHYLFKYIHRVATETPHPYLEDYYPAPNIARRVLETFLSFRIPADKGLWSKMQEVDFDDAKRARIYRFLNTHSHRDIIGDQEDDLTILAETPSVLNDLLAFMHKADSEHCSRMMDLVGG